MKIGIKLVAYGAIGLIVNSLSQLAPAINNQLAMTQLQNDNASLIALDLLNKYDGALWVVFVIIGILLFRKDIMKLIKKGIKENE